jgi:hypothetical protein
MGGKPKPGTAPDKRLKENQPAKPVAPVRKIPPTKKK